MDHSVELKPAERSATAEARSRVYALLAAIFREEPTEALLAVLTAPAMREVFEELGLSPDIGSRDTALSQTVEVLAVEYAQLFLGFGRSVSPHESVHYAADDGERGSLWGTETVKVKRFIEAAGLEYRDDYRGIPDHVSVELEFLEKLSAHEALCWKRGEAEDAAYALKIQHDFIEAHLARWLPAFCDKVVERATLPFYREMARLAKGFVENEASDLAAFGTAVLSTKPGAGS